MTTASKLSSKLRPILEKLKAEEAKIVSTMKSVLVELKDQSLDAEELALSTLVELDDQLVLDIRRTVGYDYLPELAAKVLASK